MKQIFDDLGIEVTAENKKDLDRKIHEMLGVKYKDCSTTWKEVKKRRDENEEGFLADLRAALSKAA